MNISVKGVEAKRQGCILTTECLIQLSDFFPLKVIGNLSQTELTEKDIYWLIYQEGILRKVCSEELMLLNCGIREES